MQKVASDAQFSLKSQNLVLVEPFEQLLQNKQCY